MIYYYLNNFDALMVHIIFPLTFFFIFVYSTDRIPLPLEQWSSFGPENANYGHFIVAVLSLNLEKFNLRHFLVTKFIFLYTSYILSKVVNWSNG